MLFIPKKTKFKKQQKGKQFNVISKTTGISKLNFGSIGLKSTTYGKLTSQQIDAMRQSINKVIKKSGKLVINVFPDTPISKKPVEVRMGKGKGSVDHWIAKIKSGITLCEIETSNKILGIKAMESAQYRLPVKTKIIFN